MSLIPIALAAMLAAQPPATDRPTRPAVKVMAFVGAGLLAMGLGFEVTGLAGSDPQMPASEWARTAPANTVGGLALMSAGLCFLTIAVLLTNWLPPLVVWVSPSGGGLLVGGLLP